jgi:hypothetical protein
MLKICSPGGNANHKYIEIPSHLSHNNYYQENKKQIVVRMWKKKKPLYTVGTNGNRTAI